VFVSEFRMKRRSFGLPTIMSSQPPEPVDHSSKMPASALPQWLSLAVAEERSRLARELHDTVAQTLAALVRCLDAIEEPRAEVQEARALAHAALEEVRRAIWGLRPALLEALPLHEALAREVERMADEGKLSSRVNVLGQPRALLPQQEMALFRIAQEALSNTVRHAAARRVKATLTYAEDGVSLVLEDDGQGFVSNWPVVSEVPSSEIIQENSVWPPYFAAEKSSAGLHAEASGHYGLQNMRERARQAAGSLTLESTPGKGTSITVHVPYLSGGEMTPSALLPEAATTSLPSTSRFPRPAVRTAEPGVHIQKVRVLIADDHALTRAGIRRLLESEPDMEVAGEAADGLQALAEAQDLGPQVILMDVRMPGMDGVEALRQLRAAHPDLRVLMLSAYGEDEEVFESLKAGASGYVLKDVAPQELVRVIRAVARGETLLAPGLTGKLVDHISRLAREESVAPGLTAREIEVLRALAHGLRNKEIARQLQVSERTVTFHLEHIYQKLQVSSRTEALSRALELGLLKP
jgi:DNA-binding NarL/FixJ family response regulator/two-component sensor histidine kinase